MSGKKVPADKVDLAATNTNTGHHIAVSLLLLANIRSLYGSTLVGFSALQQVCCVHFYLENKVNSRVDRMYGTSTVAQE